MFFSKSADRRINKCVDPSCVVKEGHVLALFRARENEGIKTQKQQSEKSKDANRSQNR